MEGECNARSPITQHKIEKVDDVSGTIHISDVSAADVHISDEISIGVKNISDVKRVRDRE